MTDVVHVRDGRITIVGSEDWVRAQLRRRRPQPGDLARRAGCPETEVRWLDRHWDAWRGILDTPPLVLDEPAGDDEVDVVVDAPEGTRIVPAVVVAACQGQDIDQLPVGHLVARVAGTVTAVKVAADRRSYTLTVRIRDLPAWRAALPPGDPPC